MNLQDEEDQQEENNSSSQQQYLQDEGQTNTILQYDEAMPQQRDACATLSQIDQWAEHNFFDLSSRTCVKWLAYDTEVDDVINGPQNVDARQMMKAHDVKLHISDPGDYYPGIRKRIVSLVGRGHNLMAAISKLLPALQKHQQATNEAVQKIIYSNQTLQSKEQIMLFQALFPNVVAKHLVGKEMQNKNRIQQFCDVTVYQQRQREIIPGVNTVHVDIYGSPVNVLKALICMLGSVQGFFSEDVGLEYRKFLNQSVYKHTEQAWLGVLNRSLPHNSSFKKGEYEVEFSVASGMIPHIIGKDGETLENIIKTSRAQVSIEDRGGDSSRYKIFISDQFMQVMRAQAYIIIELIKANQISQEQQQEILLQLSEEHEENQQQSEENQQQSEQIYQLSEYQQQDQQQ